MQGSAPRGLSCQEDVPLVHGNGSDKLLKISRARADLTSWYDDLDWGKNKGKSQDFALLHGEKTKRLVH